MISSFVWKKHSEFVLHEYSYQGQVQSEVTISCFPNCTKDHTITYSIIIHKIIEDKVSLGVKYRPENIFSHNGYFLVQMIIKQKLPTFFWHCAVYFLAQYFLRIALLRMEMFVMYIIISENAFLSVRPKFLRTGSKNQTNGISMSCILYV